MKNYFMLRKMSLSKTIYFSVIFVVCGGFFAFSGDAHAALNRWVAVGSGTSTIAYSDDGISWTPIASSSSLLTAGNNVIWNGSIWLAGGQGSSPIYYSYNGINWSPATSSATVFTTASRGFAWSGSRFVAVGAGTNTIAYSDDGINWSAASSSTSIFSTRGYRVIWDGTRFLAGGIGKNSLAYSADGVHWTPITSANNLFQAVQGLAWNGSVYVIGGSGTSTLAYSANGLNWTSVTNATSTFSAAGRGVAWNGTLFAMIGMGTNTLAYSYDGINWTNVASSTIIFTTQGNGMAWNGTMFVSGGNGNALAYSYDGINWIRGNSSSTVFSSILDVEGAPAPLMYPSRSAMYIAAPSRLSATAATNNISLDWSAPSDLGYPIIDYEIRYRSGAGAYVTFSHLASNQTNITVNRLSSGTSYDFTVAAVDANGAGRTVAISASTLVVTAIDGLPSQAFNKPIAPVEGFSIVLGQNLPVASSPLVSIKTNAGSDVTRMAISNTQDFSASSLIPYQADLDWNICSRGSGLMAPAFCPVGRYDIYVKLYTAYGQSSETMHISLDYQPNEKATPVSALTVSPVSVGVFISPVATFRASIAKITRFFGYGSRGSDVRALQEALTALKYYSGPITGGYYSLTRQAVIKFQKNNKIITTGYFGPLTKAALNKALR